MRSFVLRVLTLSGFDVAEVFEASDGLEALAILEQHPVDVLLTDINMPRMNGEELMRHLKEDDRWRDVPVLVVTADSTEARLGRMLAAGARGYLTKPLPPERLRAELDRVLGVAS
jgi:two-component system chemotaxis response regulator CheY